MGVCFHSCCSRSGQASKSKAASGGTQGLTEPLTSLNLYIVVRGNMSHSQLLLPANPGDASSTSACKQSTMAVNGRVKS